VVRIIKKSFTSLSQHKEGLILGHLCQLCAYDGIGPSGIEGIQWKTTFHGEGMVCLKTFGMTYFIITKSIVFITIKPCKCSVRSNLPLMENVDDQTTLCMDLS
jgi:hypothetical protein